MDTHISDTIAAITLRAAADHARDDSAEAVYLAHDRIAYLYKRFGLAVALASCKPKG